MKNFVLVIVGPTASGKSDMAVRLAKKFDGEVISADSRQVYKGLDIGTGKITKREMQGVRHHLLDISNLRSQFTASDFVYEANKALSAIRHRRKLAIICGGTGFYIDALTGAVSLPDVPPNQTLRRKLNKLDKEKLFEMLKKKDSARAETIDRHNKMRLIRALEIVQALGRVPEGNKKQETVNKKFLYIGLRPDDSDKRIYKRLIKRIPGILRETKKLSPKRAHELGLEYRYASLYLRKKLTKQEFIDHLYAAIRRYAKRQMIWFKRNRKIKWFDPQDYKRIEKYVKVWAERRPDGS